MLATLRSEDIESDVRANIARLEPLPPRRLPLLRLPRLLLLLLLLLLLSLLPPLPILQS